METTEIVIRGGWPDRDPYSIARVPGSAMHWQRRPAETASEFRARVRREAGEAETIVYDGLPAWP